MTVLENPRPGLWIRRGHSGERAYYIEGPERHGRFQGYWVSSIFHSVLFGPSMMRRDFSTLEEAQLTAERFIGGVTLERLQTMRPLNSKAYLTDVLRHLPADLLVSGRDPVP